MHSENDLMIASQGESYDAERLLKKGKIYLSTDIDDQTGMSLIEKLGVLIDKKYNPIQLFIHSGGGCVSTTMAIIDQIQYAQSKGLTVATINIGCAYSAAAVILAHGTKGARICRPNSSVMLHPVSYGMQADYQENQDKLNEFFKKVALKLDKMMSDACGVKYDKFKKDMKSGLWMGAKEAVTYGVADKMGYELEKVAKINHN